MTVTVTRIYTFEAAHALPVEFGGPATRLHGHTYTVRVTVPGGTRTEDLDGCWRDTVHPDVDHALLNEVFQDTTVEGLAATWLEHFAHFDATAVEVQEGALRFARAEA
jgi:6-pyruvoyl-tetrahydropterin synthase